MRVRTIDRVPWCPNELVLSGQERYDIAPNVTNKSRDAMAQCAAVVANNCIRKILRTNHGK